MLIDPTFRSREPTFHAIMNAIGSNRSSRRIATGLYENAHWNFGDTLADTWNDYPELGEFGPYGVCDSPEQFMEKMGAILANSQRRFVVSFVHLHKSDQSPKGGWRWHKWGEYIGNQSPRCEYLYDEPEISEVWTFHVYEQVTK